MKYLIKASILLLVIGLGITGCTKAEDERDENGSGDRNTSVQSQNIINLNDEGSAFQSKSAVQASIFQEYLKEAKTVRLFAINPVLQQVENVSIGDAVNLQLFENDNYRAQINNIVIDVNGTLVLTLKLPDYPMGFATITTSAEGRSLVTVSIPELGKSFGSRHGIDSNVNYMIEVDETKVEHPHFENDAVPVPKGIDVTGRTESHVLRPVTRANCGPSYNTNLDSEAVIDLLIVYTPAAANSSYTLQHGGINNVIAAMITLGNICLSNSKTGITLRLAHSAAVSYTETGDMAISINQLQDPSDGYMDNVHALRKQYNADLVQLLTTDSNSGGLGYVVTFTDGRYEYGFSVCWITQVADNYPCSIHEIGHNMGLGHGAQQTLVKSEGIFSFSMGWRWTGNQINQHGNYKYVSVMSYSGDYYGDGVTPAYTSYFSNPDIFYLGGATGDATKADAARSLRMMKHVVAHYGDKAIPDIPVNIVVSNPTNNGATFSWDACDNAAYYNLCVFTGSSSYRYLDKITETTVTIDHTTLFPASCAVYNMFIQAVSECDDAVSSATFTAKTKCPADPTVSTQAATGVTYDSATLNKTVTPNGDAVTEQGFKYRKASETSWTTTTNANITGLTGETTYKFHAYATTALGTINGGVLTFTTATAPTHTITASAGTNGSISPSGTVQVNHGSSQKFDLTPDTGYEIDQVLVDGVNNTAAVTSDSYTFSNITANHTISVTFKLKKYTITAAAGANGSISPSGAVQVNHGSSQKFDFTPDTDYEILQVLVDGVNNTAAVTSGSYTFSNVMANHTISVTFKLSCIPNLVIQIWDDVLSVINEPANNGGYTFTSYQWQKNGTNIPGETSGNLYLKTKDYTALYSVILTTNNGRKIQTCPLRLRTTNN
ncbi:MAG: M12 family metallo-peptidase [Mediterranea sp.]|jgi:hypothetical protein|nr:M12 family metallo-peptidase [Mediterranea sp.]